MWATPHAYIKKKYPAKLWDGKPIYRKVIDPIHCREASWGAGSQGDYH